MKAEEGSRVALLFLTRGNSNHPDVWQDFLTGYADRFSVYVHAKFPQDVTDEWMKSAIIQEHFQTDWGGLSLVRATLALLRAALQDPRNSKFILLSESCVPIKPASDLLRVMSEQPRGYVRWDRYEDIWKTHPDKSNRFLSIRGISLRHFRGQSQWMILNREMAEIVLGNDCLEAFSEAVIPDESYFATVLTASGFDLETGVVNTCPTFHTWSRAIGPKGDWRPSTYSTITEEQVGELRASSAFFARKFSSNSDIRKYRLHVD